MNEKEKSSTAYRNWMCRDLGFRQQAQDNITDITKFIDFIDKKFSLVLILEYLAESLILLRRKLNWPFHDVIFLPVMPIGGKLAKYRVPVNYTSFSADDVSRHAKWSACDQALYSHFNTSLWAIIGAEKDDFWSEVAHLKEVTREINEKCSRVGKGVPWRDITIASTVWNKQFSLDSEDCSVMTLDDMSLAGMVGEDQYGSIYKQIFSAP